MYAPTTLAPARDFWTLRYTITLENGSLVVSISFFLSPEIFILHIINETLVLDVKMHDQLLVFAESWLLLTIE